MKNLEKIVNDIRVTNLLVNVKLIRQFTEPNSEW